ncbi:SGNH/GDSL hydrolase family protein [Inquilinus sp. KBS0705]|nr:SGNH/GDSL hydrolase family protein [Inquilinus sp. KBS0705]
MAIRILTDHEYQINDGLWIACNTGNTLNNSDGSYTITQGLNVDIPIDQLKVRVKAIGDTPASAALKNAVAFNAPLAPKKIQAFFIGDSLTAGIGTTGVGTSASGNYFGVNSYPVKTISKLTGLDIDGYNMAYPGRRAVDFNPNYLIPTIGRFNKELYTDIYCIVFFGANDLCTMDSTAFVTAITETCGTLKDAGAKVILVPVLSRKDTYAASISYNNISRRNTFNAWLASNYATICDAYVDLSEHPEIFADNAPDNTTYFKDPDSDGYNKVHLTDAGADILAIAVADTITALAGTGSIPIIPVDYASNFIDAAGITDATQISAIQTLVSDLIEANIWHKLPAIYPFVGATETSNKLNLRDPRDLDVAYRLDFIGSPFYSLNGVTWHSGSYADTHFGGIGADVFNYLNCSLHYYSGAVTSAGIDIGVYSTSPFWLGIKLGGNSYTSIGDSTGTGVSESYSDLGFFTTSRVNYNKRSLYKNGTLVRDTNVNISGASGNNIWIGCLNNGDSVQYASERLCSYAAIGYGLTATEEAAHYAAIQAFQTTLGRAI